MEEDYIYFELRKKVWEMDPEHFGQDYNDTNEYNDSVLSEKEFEEVLRIIGDERVKLVGLDQKGQPQFDSIADGVIEFLKLENQERFESNPALESEYNDISFIISQKEFDMSDASDDKKFAIFCFLLLFIKEKIFSNIGNVFKSENNPLYAEFRAKIDSLPKETEEELSEKQQRAIDLALNQALDKAFNHDLNGNDAVDKWLSERLLKILDKKQMDELGETIITVLNGTLAKIPYWGMNNEDAVEQAKFDAQKLAKLTPEELKKSRNLKNFKQRVDLFLNNRKQLHEKLSLYLSEKLQETFSEGQSIYKKSSVTDESKPDIKELCSWIESVGLYEGAGIKNYFTKDVDGLLDALLGKQKENINEKKKKTGDESDRKEIGDFKYKVRMLCKSYNNNKQLCEDIKTIAAKVNDAVQNEPDKISKIIKICDGMLSIRDKIYEVNKPSALESDNVHRNHTKDNSNSDKENENVQNYNFISSTNKKLDPFLKEEIENNQENTKKPKGKF